MAQQEFISFGDTVRIRATRETRRLGIAGKTGSVYGETRAKPERDEIIGESSASFVFQVYMPDRNDMFWMVPELLEFVDHNPGMEIRLNGREKGWIRQDSGEWEALEPPRSRRWLRWLRALWRRRNPPR